MRKLVARVISRELAERLARHPQEAKDSMVPSDDTVDIGWAWEGVMFCLCRTRFIGETLASHVVFGSHTLDAAARAEPRLVLKEVVAAVCEAFARTDRARIATHLFAPDEWNQEEIYPALVEPGFWDSTHLPALLQAWDALAAIYQRAARTGAVLLLWWSESSPADEVRP